jgi:hypothetical protein
MSIVDTMSVHWTPLYSRNNGSIIFEPLWLSTNGSEIESIRQTEQGPLCRAQWIRWLEGERIPQDRGLETWNDAG